MGSCSLAMRGGTAPCCLLPACCIVVTPLYFVSSETPEVPERSEEIQVMLREDHPSPVAANKWLIRASSQEVHAIHKALVQSPNTKRRKKTKSNRTLSSLRAASFPDPQTPPHYASSIPWLGLTASRPQTPPLLGALAPKAPKPGYSQLIGYHQSAMTFQDANALLGWSVMLVFSCTILRVPTYGGLPCSSQLMHLKNCKMKIK
ncbi:hypothetical protein BGZ61DRAFT_543498 [Ilyonectria robusta]|uniref:uncharacterized protein n=1 Tax=Ilyonectria robusta TaxID=1079257 RepID=UPI001E8DEF03|nr:uncharacterized protein BGZ61DRAFT_543498 [Ilyonectria robusta]KAH8737367.1 hypothetical protein BGZ61DRAFT_543498 [Ilyonectria robusta]